MLINKIPFILVTIFVLAFCCILSDGGKIMTEDNPAADYNLLRLITYDDGTVVVMFPQLDGNANYRLQLRIVHPNGTISKSSVDHVFPENSSCDPISLSTGYLLINILGIEEKNPSAKVAHMMLVMWDGTIADNVTINYDPYRLTVVKSQTNNTFIVLSIFYEDQGMKHIYKWREYKLPDSKTSTLSSTGNSDEIIASYKTYMVLAYEVFSMQDGGYALVVEYDDDNLHEGSITKENVLKPRYRQDVIFFYPTTDIHVGPYTVFESVASNVTFLIEGCGNSPIGFGYICSTTANFFKPGSNDTQYVMTTTLLSSGSVTNRTILFTTTNSADFSEFLAYKTMLIPCGGYFIYSDEGHLFLSPLGDALYNSTVHIPYYYKALNFLQNNTLVFTYNNSDKLFIESIDIPCFYNSSLELDNPNINYTEPAINKTIQLESQEISFGYKVPVKLSQNYVSIFQIDSKNPNAPGILRQRVSATNQQFCTIENDTIHVKTLPATFNSPSSEYYVNIDYDFVRHATLNEGLGGLKGKQWKFQTEMEGDSMHSSDPITGLLRLDREQSQKFKMMKKGEQDDFYDKLHEDLVKAVPIESQRLTTARKSQRQKTNGVEHYLLSFTIQPSKNKSDRTPVKISKDMDLLIRNKTISSMSAFETTRTLDEEYGFVPKANLWEKYKAQLISGCAAFLILLLLWNLARRRHKDGNNLVIIQVALILTDMVLDIAFVVFHSKDIRELYVPSVTFLCISLGFNASMAFWIFSYEHKNTPAFFEWSSEHAKLAPAFTLLAAADIEILKMLASQLAGLKFFCAPLSKKAHLWIFWASMANIFIEDVPQLSIQIVYHTRAVFADIVPFLTLITSSIVLLINILSSALTLVHYVRTGQVRYLPPMQKEEQSPLDDQNASANTECNEDLKSLSSNADLKDEKWDLEQDPEQDLEVANAHPESD